MGNGAGVFAPPRDSRLTGNETIRGEATKGPQYQDVVGFVHRVIGRLGIDPSDYTVGELISINEEYEIEKSIDRACAAQSTDLLPKFAPTAEEKAAKKKAIEARINAKFAGR